MRRLQNGVTRKVELVECVHPEDAGAMDRHANRLMLFDDEGAVAEGREIARRKKTSGTGADNDDVAPPRRQYLRSLDSHVPRKLIQNERRIKRISRVNDRRRMYSRS